MSDFRETQELPEFVRAVGGDVRNSDLPAWSGAGDPPKIGEEILISSGAVGPCKVEAYIVYRGWLGVKLQPVNPPAWFVQRRRSGNTVIHAFGAEIQS